MKKLLRLAAALVFAASTAGAQPITCAGQDLIAALDATARAELDRAVDQAPYPQGNHWRATRGARTIDIVGTFHLFDPRMVPAAAALTPLIADADRVYLEATDREMAELQKAMSERSDLLLTSGPTLPERLSETEWQELSAAMTERGIPAFMASKFQPWYVSVLLSIPPCAMKAMAGGSTGLDHMIGQAADTAGTETAALEPFDTIFTLFATIPPDEQLDMIRAALPTAARSEDLFATMAASYFREDHRQIWEFARMAALSAAPEQADKLAADFAQMEEALINRRNRAWMEVIEADPSDRLVVAVGAGHLAGQSGLLKLLEQAGYRLERAAFQ